MGLILGFKPFKLFKTEAFEGLFDNDGSVSYIFTQLFYFLLSITIILIMAFVFMINILKSLYYWKLYIYIFLIQGFPRLQPFIMSQSLSCLFRYQFH